MAKRNSMLNTEEGAKRYYAYQKEYRKSHSTRIGFVVSKAKDAALLKAIEELPSHGQTKNGYLREAVIEKLLRDGYLERKEVPIGPIN